MWAMTIAVDFDGPVHLYSQGWHDGTVYDHPTPGAFDALRYLMALEPVFIFTARPVQDTAAWLADRGGFRVLVDDGALGLTFWDRRDVLLVTGHKYPARVYVDDRAVVFRPETGWDDTLRQLARRLPVPPGEAPAAR